MKHFSRPARSSGRKAAAATIAAIAGFAVAALVGVAVAKTFTLHVADQAKVTDQSGSTTTENIAVNSHGFAVYVLTGDSKAHPECTKANGCFSFWPPLTVSSPKKLSKAPGVKGKLGVWHRNGFFQVTLAGHPLYRYAADSHRHAATGQGLQSFGGTWHVVKAAGSAGGGTTMSVTATTTTSGTTSTGGTTSTNTTTTSTTTTTPCLYAPCY